MISIGELFNKKEDCCGCELCTVVCVKGVLSMKPDEEGFLYPCIENAENCVDCKRCVNICPNKYSKRPYQEIKKGYGGHSNDESEVKSSSSGGLATIIGRYIIKNGGIVYGVRYSEDFHSARYERAENEIEINRFRTSKYFQSKKGDVFQLVKKDLIDLKKVLFVGLNCEISALYNYLGCCPDNLYTVSLVCHGVTSPLVHEQFCTDLENRYSSKISDFSVRYKVNGWKPYYIKASFINGNDYLKPFVSTDYEIAFKFLKRPSCSKCRFKILNKDFGIKSDLVIGDYHGQKNTDSFYNKWGASKFFSCTPKGEELIKAVDDLFYSEINIDKLRWSSPVLSIPTKKLLFHNIYSTAFKKNGLKNASNMAIIQLSYKYIQPLIKKYHSIIRRVQVRLFNKVRIW